MKPYSERTTEELKELKAQLEGEYKDFKAQELFLNIARGKPSAAQLDLSDGLLKAVSEREDCFAEDGTDCRKLWRTIGASGSKKAYGRGRRSTGGSGNCLRKCKPSYNV